MKGICVGTLCFLEGFFMRTQKMIKVLVQFAGSFLMAPFSLCGSMSLFCLEATCNVDARSTLGNPLRFRHWWEKNPTSKKL